MGGGTGSVGNAGADGAGRTGTVGAGTKTRGVRAAAALAWGRAEEPKESVVAAVLAEESAAPASAKAPVPTGGAGR
jgi:hypothetical protein